MTVLDLSMTCTGVTAIKQIDFRDGMGQGPAVVEIIATAHTLSVGDTVTVSFGYTGSTQTFITDGVVRKIITRVPDYNYAITIHDKLGRAVDYFMASDNPDSPYLATNIEASALVVALLALAGVTPVTATTTIFTYGTRGAVKINLVSVWGMVEQIDRITGYDTYVNGAGTVFFADRPPYITASDTVAAYSFTAGSSGELISAEYDRNVEFLRNRIVVYGGPGIFYTASAISPYLPAGFYKTLVVGHPLIDNQTAAVSTGDANLITFNRLTQTLQISTLGVASIRARAVVDVTESFTGFTSATKWLVFGSHHLISQSGYTCEFSLVR